MALSKITNASVADNAIHGRRNLILNGACQVAQRSSSVTGITTAGYYTVDRMKPQFSSLGTWTIEQSTDAPDGFSNSIKMTATTADASPSASDYAQMMHRIEAQNLQHLQVGTSSAKSTTLSFYVKATKTGSFTLVARTFDTSTRMFSKNITVSSANTWEYKTVTIPADTGGDIANDNGVGIEIAFWFNAGSTFSGGSEMSTWAAQVNANKYLGTIDIGASTNDAIQFTGIQLEVGDASPFEHRSYGEELAACQRYTYVFNSQKINGEKSLCNLAKWSNGYAYGSFSFPMEMRTAPAATIYNKTEFYVYIAGSVGQVSGSDTFGVSNQTTDIGEVYIECGEGSSGQAGFMRKAGSASGTSSGYIVLDAEL